MKNIKASIILLLVAVSLPSVAQTETAKPYHNFPLIITLQFHNFSLPFHDMLTNFSNIGIGIGTEVSYNGKQNWVQQINALWYRNKAMGNGLMFYSQAAWRPTINSGTYTEAKFGAACLLAFRPTESFRQINGKWTSVGHKGKAMLALPVGISMGHNYYSGNTGISPFVTYQFLLVSDYNKSIPLVPETLMQAGVRIK